MARTLTQEESDDKNSAADLYIILQGNGVTDQQIADVWAAMQEAQ